MTYSRELDGMIAMWAAILPDDYTDFEAASESEEPPFERAAALDYGVLLAVLDRCRRFGFDFSLSFDRDDSPRQFRANVQTERTRSDGFGNGPGVAALEAYVGARRSAGLLDRDGPVSRACPSCGIEAIEAPDGRYCAVCGWNDGEPT